MSLADERRAIAAGVSASRQSTSESSRASSSQAIAAGRTPTSESARRALGRSLVEQRRAKTLQGDLNALKQPERPTRALSVREQTGGRASTRGVGTWDPSTPAVGDGGGGIASPLTEPLFSERTWWDDGWLTSDGLFTIPMPKKIVMTDANGAQVVFEYANPNPPVGP